MAGPGAGRTPGATARDRLAILLVVLAIGGGGCRASPGGAAACTLDDHAHEYRELVAALAARDPPSVDSAMPRPATPLTSGLLRSGARDLRRHLERDHRGASDDGRVAAFARQLIALEARAEQIGGVRLTYADEMTRLLGSPALLAVPDDGALQDLDRLLPGPGRLARRLAAHDRRVAVPPDRLAAVVTRAIAICRERTLVHLALPPGERLDLQFVPGAAWSGYSRYQGGYRSTMAINTQWPLPVDRVLDLACHEGYPGHHVINGLRDQLLVERNGWIEAGPLLTFSPPGFANEALASAAPRLVFTDAERLRIVRDELFPLAGLDPAGAERHVRIGGVLARLDGRTAEITRAYLTGERDVGATAEALRAAAAMDHPEATLQFIDGYRAYATAYSGGRASAWQLLGPDRPDAERWRRYRALMLQGRLSDVR